MKGKIGQIIDVVLVVCAISLTVATFRERLFPPVLNASRSGAVDSTAVADWRDLASTGTWMGPRDASLVILEWADFECPACRAYAPVLSDLRKRHPNDVAVVFKHYPLAYHRFAKITARYANCASAQGKFESFHDVLYAKQDSFGLKPWSEYASEAAISDFAALAKCASSSSADSLFAASEAEAKRVGSRGTPTIVVNGWRLGRLPDSAEWNALIARAQSERRAVGGTP